MNSLNLLHINEQMKANKISFGILVFGFVYWAYGEPEILTFFAVSIAITTVIGNIFKLKFQHCLLVATAITFVLSFQTASHALIFETLEDTMTEVLTATGDSVDEGVITGFFAFIRIVIGIGFIVGIVMAIVRATSGADWTPVATALGIAVFGVISIEVMTNLLVGS